MASAILGLVLDSSVLVGAERSKRTTRDVIQHIRAAVGDVPIIICALTAPIAARNVARALVPFINHPTRTPAQGELPLELRQTRRAG